MELSIRAFKLLGSEVIYTPSADILWLEKETYTSLGHKRMVPRGTWFAVQVYSMREEDTATSQ